MGGRNVGQIAAQATSFIASPVVASVKIAETVAPKQSAAVEKSVPIVGTLAQGVKGAANITSDIVGGDSAALKADIGASISAVKAGESLATFQGAIINGNTTFDNAGFNFNDLIPKPGPSPLPAPGTTGQYFAKPPSLPSIEGDTGGGMTVVIAGVLVLVFILIIKKGK